MKSNKLEFSIGSEYGLDFVEKEHSITHDDDYGSTTMSGHTLTVNANRHGCGGVASKFKTNNRSRRDRYLGMTAAIPQVPPHGYVREARLFFIPIRL